MNLAGTRVLVVEDDSLIRLMMVSVLEDAGCIVSASLGKLADAMKAAASLEFDAGLLDINLDGESSYPIGDVLVARGIPLVFSTAYDAGVLPARFNAVPLLTKPFDGSQLVTQLCIALRTVRQ